MRDNRAETPVLQAVGIHKAYHSGRREIRVLQGVDLSLGKGQSVSIRGESGSGKSTLLNLLAGIETPDKGDIFWKSASLLSIPPVRRPKIRSTYLGFVFQAYYLIPELNTLENVALAGRIAGNSMKDARGRARILLGELGLQDRLKSRPDQLSGGERQRAAIARALMNQPEVVLADEPTGNLDEHTSERVMEQLISVAEKHGATLVLVTHHPGYAARTQIQYHLEEGRLIRS